MSKPNGWRKWGVVLTAVAMAVAVIAFVLHTEWTAQAAEEKVKDHETRIRTVEQKLDKIGTDVEWIRKILEERTKETPK